MLNARREESNLLDRGDQGSSRRTAQIRLFGLLGLLIPLFAGLQLVVREGVPRVEVRLVSQDVQTTVPVVVPVEVPVEKVVERVVFVSVERQEALPPDSEMEPARGNVSPAPDLAASTGAERDDPAPVVADAESDGPALGVAVAAEEPTDVPPLVGSVAMAPPPVAPVAPRRVAAPVVVAARAPAVVEEPADDTAPDEPVVAMEESAADIVDEDLVAEAQAEETPVVATERVALFSSEVPVVREDDGPSIGMLRHDLFVTVSKPAPPQEEAAVQAPPEEAVAAESEGAPPFDATATEEPSEGMSEAQPEGGDTAVEPEAEAEPEAVATRTTESLLSEAATVRADVVDSGSNNGPSIAVVEHQLVARPAEPERVPERKAEPQSEVLEDVTSDGVSDEQGAEPIAEASPGDGEQDGAEASEVSVVERRQEELAIVGDGQAEDEGEPGQ